MPNADPQQSSTASQPALSRWAIHRRLYNWVLSWAHSRHSSSALFLLSFTESSFFPIPPDALQIALTLEKRERAWFYATLSSIASVLGGAFGYFIGWAFWHVLDDFFYQYVPGVKPEIFGRVQTLYEDHNFWIVFAAAFTPIPYKVFTIAAGVFGVSFPMFIIASLIGRSARFFLVAALLWKFGPPIRSFIDKYFNWLCILAAAALIAAFAIFKYMR